MGILTNLKYLAVILSALGLVYSGYHYRDIKAENEIQEIRLDAQTIFIQTQKIVKAYEQGLQGMANKLEEQSYENKIKRDNELQYYRNLIAQSGGLYDPYGQTGDSTTTGSSSNNQTTASGPRLSAEATGFLLDQANKADRVVDQYLQCQKYITLLSEKTK